MLKIVYIAQVIIVSFSNEAIVYVTKKNRSKVWLWLSSKMNVFKCLLCPIMTWVEELSTNCRRKQKRTSKRYKRGNNLYRSAISMSVVALVMNTPVRTNNV